jgi:hypothetical protein
VARKKAVDTQAPTAAATLRTPSVLVEISHARLSSRNAAATAASQPSHRGSAPVVRIATAMASIPTSAGSTWALPTRPDSTERVVRMVVSGPPAAPYWTTAR